MKYQFENPPTREGIIQEFGIHPDCLHRIQTFIESSVPNEDDFDSSKEQFSMVEAAFILKKLNLIEAFALLCSLPWNGWGRLVTLPGFFCAPHGVTESMVIEACFDKFGALEHFKIEKIPDFSFSPWAFETRVPSALIADREWLESHYEAAENAEHWMEDFTYSTAVAAVSSCPLSETQWRRKFVAEGWADSERQIATRLTGDPALLASWNSFLSGPTRAFAKLSQFETWDAGRDSWDMKPGPAFENFRAPLT